jgi:uncharacterized protein YndB with AHSA1/START domain
LIGLMPFWPQREKTKMADIRLERDFKVTAERLFRVVTEHAQLLQWWGHDGMVVQKEHIDFSKTGPWFFDMSDQNGQRFKMSGQVTHVDSPRSVGFTWGWHDETDQRGKESHVTFTIVPTASGARLIVDHRELPDSEIATRHEAGWSATLVRLGRILN